MFLVEVEEEKDGTVAIAHSHRTHEEGSLKLNCRMKRQKGERQEIVLSEAGLRSPSQAEAIVDSDLQLRSY